MNRIWQYHFGRGLVKTPNDFGVRGIPPSHPELLDHLASQFIQSGWSVKAMHRLLILSRLISNLRPPTRTAPDDAVDTPAAEFYAAFARRRLSARRNPRLDSRDQRRA